MRQTVQSLFDQEIHGKKETQKRRCKKNESFSTAGGKEVM
jgi:hypothetical protein